MQKLNSRVCIITGGAEGIGAAIAEAFAAAGADLALFDLQEKPLQALSARLEATHAIQALPIVADISATDAVNAAVSRTQNHFSKIDILVNNAAIAVSGHAWEMPDADWERVINTNLSGPFRLIRAVLPGMIERGSGVILNISSTQAHRSWPGWTAYAAAKGGILSMTRQLAGELGANGIRVNSLSPGAIDTPMNQRRIAQEGEQLREQWASMHALERTGKPIEVAEAALFLCSDASSFITGHDLLVDGGLTTLPKS